MANLTVRLLIVVFSTLMALSLLFSYQFSTSAINQEVERNLQQTASLIQNLFDYKLGSVQALQDNQSKSATLLSYVESGSVRKTDDYFVASERAVLNSTPDFRFITTGSHVFWDDGNSPFFGVTQDKLIEFSQSVIFHNSWYYTTVDTEIGDVQVLFRKSPIVNDASGEVVGTLYIGIVLDNNYALVEHLKTASNTQDIVLTINNKPVASTVHLGSELYKRIFNAADFGETLIDDHLYGKVNLKISGVDTPLSVYSIQTNQNILTLEKNFRLSFIFSALSIILAAVLARVLIQRRINGELNKLMAYAQGARENRDIKPFQGSVVYEFDHIGLTLEHTFEELIEKEKSFQDLFRFAVSPILVWDKDLNIIRMNPAAEKAFTENNRFNEDAFQQFQKSVYKKLVTVKAGATLSGTNIDIAATVYRWNISPVIMENGVHSIIGQGQDITTLIEAENQSNLARLEAEKSARERADFLARMSHEIRTPLNGILGISSILKKTLKEPEQEEKVDVLVQSGEHLLAVLNDILDFSKIEKGKFKIVHNDFLFDNVLESIENIYLPLCQEKGIQLKVQTNQDSGIYLRTDQVRLNQILFNLLSNAVKFTHIGHIKVTIDINNTASGYSDLIVIVEDTGIGISKQNLSHIFEPFVQSEKTSTREYGGSGLGLAIVKNLVELMDGTIEIDSTEGFGTRIRVNLPVEMVDENIALKVDDYSDTYADFLGKSLKALIVEDNQTNAFIAKTFCEKYGMEVEWATDGYKALESLKENAFDIILMDNQMPNLDGIDATARIRSMGIDTPIVACTADGFDSTRQAFLKAGADYVLVKPIKEAHFAEALRYYKNKFLD
ncbi:LuxQ periplasmic sensor domain-containing protein [Vibrio hannami]|uniref:LuxQ periplasmic sensor domain-containing protein n=1 Tax=Vibrio hannami TaxID=2717094 RepID=UPI00241059EA|nr:LuxQ periplasmic sensor domain-containing protein [Vibrio hannami]MDG3085219.1 LuxQ periplasmic sensor domain-containing protein [Vibrio hannami]